MRLPAKNIAPLEQTFSVYLDLLRSLAAFAVLFGHMEKDGLGMSWNPLARFSHEGVIVFFVLSGFIICQTTVIKNRGGGDYFSARLSRLYSVVVPSIVACSALTLIIGAVVPDPHTKFSNYHEFRLFHIMPQLTFLTESWGIGKAIPMNYPYWSLCYEFWYYVLFGIAYFYRNLFGLLFLTLSAVIAGPAIIVLSPIWIAGAWLAYYGGDLRFPRPVAMLVFVASIGAVYLVDHSGIDVTLRSFLHDSVPGFWRLSSSQRFLTDYIIGAAVVVNLIASRSLTTELAPILRTIRMPIAFFAGYSFTLYMFHRPLTQIGGWAFPVEGNDVVGSLVATALIAGITFFVSFGTERKLGWWRSRVARFLHACSHRTKSICDSV